MENTVRKSSRRKLVELYRRNGCMRLPDKTRRKEEGQKYKKGYEVRLIARDEEELALIRGLLKDVGLKSGRAYAHGGQWCQPIYGKASMEEFNEWLENL